MSCDYFYPSDKQFTNNLKLPISYSLDSMLQIALINGTKYNNVLLIMSVFVKRKAIDM